MEQSTQKHIITALRPFSFIEPATEKQRLPPEHKFMPQRDAKGNFIPTDFEVPEFVAKHEWITKNFADGAVESPASREQRLKIQAAADNARQEIIDQSKAEAEAALVRAEGNATRQIAGSEAMTRELNTPVGSTPSVITDQDAFNHEINTPISELRSKAAGKRAAKTA